MFLFTSFILACFVVVVVVVVVVTATSSSSLVTLMSHNVQTNLFEHKSNVWISPGEY